MRFITLQQPALNTCARRQSEHTSSLMIEARDLPADCLAVVGNLGHMSCFKPATAADRDLLVSFLRALKYAEPLPEVGAPNLDAMADDDLEAFAVKYERAARRKHARVMFPEAERGHVRALESLGHYARNLLTVRQCRIRGDIISAQNYETICEGIYTRLPAFARW